MTDRLVERVIEAAREAACDRHVTVVDHRRKDEGIHHHRSAADEGAIILVITEGKRGATVERLPFRSEGYQGQRSLITRDLRGVAGIVERGVALLRREDLVEGHGTRETPYPAWAFVMHPLAIRLMQVAGARIDLCGRSATWRITERGTSANGAWNAARERSHVRMHTPEPFGPGGRGSLELEANGARIRARLLSMRVGGAFLLLNETAGHTTLTLDVGLPETAVANAAGRRLDQVVEGDWGAAADVRLKSAMLVGRDGDASYGPRWWTCLTLEQEIQPLTPGPDAEIIAKAA